MEIRPAPIRVDADHERRYPGADRLATEVAVNLLRTESLVTAYLSNVLRRHGLSVATFNVLMILDGADAPLCPREIADRLLVTGATITGVLDSLEKKGLVKRGPHPDDRRMLLVRTTAKGRKLLSAVVPDFFPAEAQMTCALTRAEKETLVRLLGKMQSELNAPSDG